MNDKEISRKTYQEISSIFYEIKSSLERNNVNKIWSLLSICNNFVRFILYMRFINRPFLSFFQEIISTFLKDRFQQSQKEL
jgi:hypothetical protein